MVLRAELRSIGGHADLQGMRLPVSKKNSLFAIRFVADEHRRNHNAIIRIFKFRQREREKSLLMPIAPSPQRSKKPQHKLNSSRPERRQDDLDRLAIPDFAGEGIKVGGWNEQLCGIVCPVY